MQKGLTLVAPLAQGADPAALETLLRNAGDQLQQGWLNGARSPLDEVRQLHFLSMFVVPAQGTQPPALVLEANFDGDAEAFLDRLAETNAALLDLAYRYCAGYPGNAGLRAFLGNARQRNNLFFVGCPGLTTTRIAEDSAIAAEVDAGFAALSSLRARRWQIVRHVWQRLSPQTRERVLNTPERPLGVRQPLIEMPFTHVYERLKWWLVVFGWAALILVLAQACGNPVWSAVAPDDRVVSATLTWTVALLAFAAILSVAWACIWIGEFPDGLSRRTFWYVIGAKLGDFFWTTLCALPGFGTLLGLIALAHWHHGPIGIVAAVVLGALLAGALVAALVWTVRLLQIGTEEPGDVVYDLAWDPQRLTALRRREDDLAQTHLVSVTEVRPSAVRLATLRCVLFVIHWAARILYNPRGLFNTQSIHFARWTILPGRRLLFISNYDGSFGGYLGVFATLGAGGVSAIWGNTLGFPRTFLLYLDGARDEQRFKARARASQIESALWYRRYPRLSVSTIERNARLRDDLARFSRLGFRVPEAELDAFLRRFASPSP